MLQFFQNITFSHAQATQSILNTQKEAHRHNTPRAKPKTTTATCCFKILPYDYYTWRITIYHLRCLWCKKISNSKPAIMPKRSNIRGITTTIIIGRNSNSRSRKISSRSQNNKIICPNPHQGNVKSSVCYFNFFSCNYFLERKKDDKQQQQGGGDPFGLVFDPVPGQTNSPNTEEPPQQDPVHHGPVDNSDDSDISPITPIHVPMKRMPSAHLLQEAAKKK